LEDRLKQVLDLKALLNTANREKSELAQNTTAKSLDIIHETQEVNNVIIQDYERSQKMNEDYQLKQQNLDSQLTNLQ
jgi:hypothetical protein